MRHSKRGRVVWGPVALAYAAWLWSGDASAELAPLRTAAALSGRPKACTPQSPEQASVWQDARAEGTPGSKLCARMAHIGRLLTTDPALARRLVEEAASLSTSEQIWRGPAGLEVPFRMLTARVALANGESRVASELFHLSATQLPISEWDSGTLRDYAVSALAQAQYQDVVGIYRRLVAVSAWLDARTRIEVRIEAAVAVLRLPQPDTIEALGYLSGLDANDSDSSIATLVGAVQSLTRHSGSSAEPIERSVHNEVDVSSKEIRPLARLSEHDWRLIESWMAWTRTRDSAVWSWTAEPGVPGSYRTLAVKLTGGG
jgi:hypothetical protein